jgi:hypothetical protein
MKMYGLGETYNWSVTGRTWFPAMTSEQVLQDGIEAAVFLTVEFRVLVEGEVPGAANFLHRAQHAGRLALQHLEFLAHKFCSDGRGFYGLDSAEQGYFRTPLWISCSGQ